MTQTLTPVALAAVVLLAVPGCGDGRLACYPVRGQVFIDGEPAYGGKVYFFPIKAPSDPRATCPIGNVNEAGDFVVTTYVQGDGVPAGEYVLCVEWPSKHPLRGTFDGGDRLGGRYMKRQDSQYKCTINPGQNDIPRFDLKGPGKKGKPEAGILGGGN